VRVGLRMPVELRVLVLDRLAMAKGGTVTAAVPAADGEPVAGDGRALRRLASGAP